MACSRKFPPRLVGMLVIEHGSNLSVSVTVSCIASQREDVRVPHATVWCAISAGSQLMASTRMQPVARVKSCRYSRANTGAGQARGRGSGSRHQRTDESSCQFCLIKKRPFPSTAAPIGGHQCHYAAPAPHGKDSSGNRTIMALRAAELRRLLVLRGDTVLPLSLASRCRPASTSARGDEGASSNAYDVLGVGETSSSAEIKASFHRLAKETHPDVAAAAGSFRSLRPTRFYPIRSEGLTMIASCVHRG
ncbi:hypothetical protein ACQ4PT_044214 [Festuca glaucescens]